MCGTPRRHMSEYSKLMLSDYRAEREQKPKEFRCPCCRRLLFKANKVSGVEIKCPKCRNLMNIA